MKYDINNPRPTPSQERLKHLLNYDPATGILTWKNHKNRTDLNGKVAGGKRNKDGYLTVNIGGYKFSAHRIIYKLMTGEEASIIDHVNGKKDDNRWHNLRSVSNQQNNMNVGLLKNNKTGTAGVFYHVKQNRWHANVRIDGKSYHLGSYKSEAEAKAARKSTNIMLCFSERHGKAS